MSFGNKIYILVFFIYFIIIFFYAIAVVNNLLK